MNTELYDLMNWRDIEEIVYSECAHPEHLLGPHKVGDRYLIQAFVPGAQELKLEFMDSKQKVPMELEDEAGFFACLISEKELPLYHYLATFEEEGEVAVPECYRFMPVLTDKERKAFAQGKYTKAGELLGAHLEKHENGNGICFRVYAPHALRVSVVGQFNRFDGRMHQMSREQDSGFFSLFIPGLSEETEYCYEIKDRHGNCFLKQDPYGTKQLFGERNLSAVCKEKNFRWEDSSFLENRKKHIKGIKAPAIYEMNFKDFLSEKKSGFKKQVEETICHIKKMGYTHVVLMPLMASAAEETGGYETAGYFALSTCFGAPHDVKYVMNELHKAGLLVLMDYTPGAFPMEEWGLRYFDGACLYEYPDDRQKYRADGRAFRFNFGEPAVTNMLLSAACYWLEKYHLDGLRLHGMDAMLYNNYDRDDWNSVRNIYGGFENLEAVSFVRELVNVVHKCAASAVLWAGEAYAWPNSTAAVAENGLGLDYITLFRKENWLYEGVKETLQEEVQKVYFGYRILKPGTKIFAPWEEKSSTTEAFVAELLKLYEKNDAFWESGELVYQPSDRNGMGLDAFLRKGKQSFLVLMNQTGETINACVKVDEQGTYKPVLNAGDSKFGGLGEFHPTVLDGMPDDRLENPDEQESFVHVSVPAYGVLVYLYAPFTKEDLNRIAKVRMEIKKQALEEKLQEVDRQLAELLAKKENIREKYDQVLQKIRELS